MAIKVVFTKEGFVHPAFGRMGRGKMQGAVYQLPDLFGEEGMLPKSATIITDAELEDVLEDIEQAKPFKPRVVDQAQMDKAKEQVAKRKSAKSKAAAK